MSIKKSQSRKKTASKRKKSPSRKKTAASSTAEQTLSKNHTSQLHIVGIGASAGGLEAFNTFFTAMPESYDLAFVLISHLDPEHTSILPELIQHKTKMKVYQITDNMKIEANSVYIIPPKKEIALLNDTLQLLEMMQPHGLNRPIDSFFRSLAQDQGKNAIGIVLSGTGTDGTLGLREIKAKGGLVIVQDTNSAKYDGMPLNAITTGLVDFVLPPEKIPEQLLKYIKHQTQNTAYPLNNKNKSILNSLQKIYILLRAQTNHDFSLYKKNTICRRIERRMHINQIENIDDYVRYLQRSDSEVSGLFKELLIGVTSFFRDPAAFESLQKQHLPNLLRDKPNNYLVRIWVPGCSNGEEAYSIAIAFKEYMKDSKCQFNVQIFGTDLDDDAINKARKGLYPESISIDVSPERLKRFFIKEENHYQITKAIREMVVFAPQNIINDPPFTKLDLLCCRNLLIYFASELQKKLLPIFHYSLKPGGILFLGSSESIGQYTDFFSPLDKKWKIYERIPDKLLTRPVFNLLPPAISTSLPEQKMTTSPETDKDINTLKLLNTILSQSDLSTRVVINNKADIIYIHGKTGRFLEPAEGAISTNIIEMARPDLKAGLTHTIHQLVMNGKQSEIKGLQIKDNDGYLKVNLSIKPFPDSQTGQKGLMMVIFEETTPTEDRTNHADSPIKHKPKSNELKKLEDELQYTKENLQSTIEELETSNEEMKSINEELQSTNEELQSTNEELETSKEELQSLNEESTTVNAELQSRIDELLKAKDDIKNLLDATDIASLFLDIDLRIRRFTPKAVDLFPITISDIGRPISHFTSKLKGIGINQYAQQVLDDLALQEVEVIDNDGKTYRMRIRPYRTINNVIDGIVITFEDITKIKKIEIELNTLSSGFEERMLMMSKVFMDGADPIIIEDLDGKIIEVNEEATHIYGWSREQLIGQNIQVLVPSESLGETKKLINRCKANRIPLRNIKSLRKHKSGQTIPVLVTFTLLTDLNGDMCAIASIAKNNPFPETINTDNSHEKE